MATEELEIVDYSVTENNYATVYFKEPGSEVKAKVSFWIPEENFVGLHEAEIVGVNTMNQDFGPINVEINIQESSGEPIDPTKVFWLIYKAARKILCPTCNNGY